MAGFADPREPMVSVQMGDVFVNDEVLTAEESSRNLLMYGVPGTVLAFADTVSDSLGMTDDGEVMGAVGEYLPRFGDYMSRNKEALEVAGDITGMLIPGTAAVKIIQGPMWLRRAMGGLGNNRHIRSIFTSGTSLDHAMRPLRRFDTWLARDMAVRAFTARSPAAQLARTMPGVGQVTRNQLTNAVWARRLSDAAKEGIAFEAGVALTMHDSEVLYPEDWSLGSHLAMAAGGVALNVGIEALMVRRAMRRGINSVVSQAYSRLNPEGVNYGEVRYRPTDQYGNGDRSVGISLLSAQQVRLGMDIDEAVREGVDVLATNLNNERFALREETLKQIQQLGKDRPVERLNHSFTMSMPEARAIENAQSIDPLSALGAISAERMPEKGYAGILKMYDEGRKYFRSLGDEAKRLRNEFVHGTYDKKTKVWTPAEQARKDEIRNRLMEIERERSFVAGWEYVVNEADGTLVPARQRKDVFQDNEKNRIRTERATELEPGRFWADNYTDPRTGMKMPKIGATDDFRVIVPAVEAADIGVSRRNIVQRARGTADPISDMVFGTIYKAFNDGSGGSRILANLSPEARALLDPKARPALFAAMEKGTKEGREVIEAFEPMRRAIFDAKRTHDHTTLLYFTKGKDSDQVGAIATFTNSLEAARARGGRVYTKRVAIDDIAAVIPRASASGEHYDVVVRNASSQLKEADVGRDILKLGLLPNTAAQAAMQKAIESRFVNGKYVPLKDNVQLSTDEHWLRIDAILETIERGGDAAKSNIRLPRAYGDDWELLKWQGLRGKFEGYVAFVKAMERQAKGPLRIKEHERIQAEDIRKILNLPRSNLSAFPHPIEELFSHAYAQGARTLDEAFASMDHFMRAIQEVVENMKQVPFRAKEMKLRGNQLKIPNDAKPVILVKRSVSVDDFRRDQLERQLQQGNEFATNMLLKGEEYGAPLTGMVANLIHSLSMTPYAKNIEHLGEGGMAGTAAFSQVSHAIRDNPTLRAADQLASVSDRRVNDYIRRLFQPAHQPWNHLRSPAGRDDLHSWNHFYEARSQGWDLEDATVPVTANGRNMHSFKLRDTERNRQRFERLFGTPMPKDAVMPQVAKEYKPFLMTEKAYEYGAVIVRDMGKMYLNELNTIRRALGYNPVPAKEWWVPPRNISDREVRYVLWENGDTKTVVTGRTVQDVEQKARQVIDSMGGKGLVVSQKQMGRWYRAEDEAFAKLADYSDPLNQTGAATGAISLPIIERGDALFNEVTLRLQRSFEGIGKRARAAYFQPQLNFAKRAARAVGSVDPNKNVWEVYGSLMYGTSIADISRNADTIIGKAYWGIESIYDDMLEALHDKALQRGWKGGLDFKANLRQALDPDGKKEFARLQESLREHQPFQNAVEYAQRTYSTPPPPTMKAHMSKLSQMTGLFTLRLFEIAHAALNYISLGANMPAVIRGLAKMADETDAEWMARIGGFGSVHGKQFKVPMFSGARASAGAISRWFNDVEFKKLIDEANEQGYLEQEITERMRTVTAPSDGYVSQLVSRYGQWATWMADSSEKWSRGIAFATGLHMAEKMLQFQNKNDMFAFAHKFANDVIGDYRPTNRPRIFQGAVGMPLGLFQTFMWNYGQRVLGYIENAQWRALATQYFMQTAVFGAESVPGFHQFSTWFATGAEGQSNVVDGLQNKFGTDFTDWLLYGTLSNLPKFLGQDGIALYSRGDANIRQIPGIWNVQNTPVANLLGEVGGAINDTVDMIRQGASVQQTMEIMAAHSINRPIRYLWEIAAGYSLDARGQVISDEVRNGFSIATRLAGFRPMSEQKGLEAWARIRSTQFSQAEKMDSLRDAIRSSIRGGTINMDTLREALHTYIRYGGRPEYFGTWLRRQFLAATVSKLDREFLEAMRDPGRGYDMLRLMNTGALSVGEF